eukprot:1281520-Prymnesium_polylepis.1
MGVTDCMYPARMAYGLWFYTMRGHTHRVWYYSGHWPMVCNKAVLERYAALQCLWHGVRGVERSNR